jgi:outer membrane protein
MPYMKLKLVTSTLGAVFLLASAGPVLAQAKPAAPAPAPAPAQPAATTPPSLAPAPAQGPPKPFPEGAKIAYVNVQAIASNSVEGKAASAKVAELQKQKVAELGEKNKQLQALQTKLQQGGSVLSDQARGQLEKDIEKMQRDIQFFQQDANSELQDLQTNLQNDFQEKLNPVLEQVATEKGLNMLLDIGNSGAVWANTGLDLSAEVIRRFDAASKAGTPAPAAATPAPATPAPATTPAPVKK